VLGKVPDQPANDAHVVGQMLLEPFEHRKIRVLGVGPGVGLELVPIGDRAAVLFHKVAPALARQVGGLLGHQAVGRHRHAHRLAEHIVVA
jgi:hypothetical protein